jgi:hypothetical protein
MGTQVPSTNPIADFGSVLIIDNNAIISLIFQNHALIYREQLHEIICRIGETPGRD